MLPFLFGLAVFPVLLVLTLLAARAYDALLLGAFPIQRKNRWRPALWLSSCGQVAVKWPGSTQLRVFGRSHAGRSRCWFVLGRDL